MTTRLENNCCLVIAVTSIYTYLYSFEAPTKLRTCAVGLSIIILIITVNQTLGMVIIFPLSFLLLPYLIDTAIPNKLNIKTKFYFHSFIAIAKFHYYYFVTIPVWAVSVYTI